VGTNAVLHAVREPPRAPVLENPRPLGAGVGACFYDFELCSECGSKLVEHNGLLVCSGCGLAATPVYEPPQLKTLELWNSNKDSNRGNGKGNGCNPVIGCKVGRALEALAGELRIPAYAVLGVYKRALVLTNLMIRSRLTMTS